jgi:hypothetical protein
VVVDAEVNETNKTTLWSERVGVLAREKKGDKKFEKAAKKDLTEPTLLEMPGKSPNPPTGCWCQPGVGNPAG